MGKASGDSVACIFGESQLTFVSGSMSVYTPAHYSNRSRLLSDLRDETDLDVEVPLALSMKQLMAWKACVQAIERQARTDDSQILRVKDDLALPGLVVWLPGHMFACISVTDRCNIRRGEQSQCVR